MQNEIERFEFTFTVIVDSDHGLDAALTAAQDHLLYEIQDCKGKHLEYAVKKTARDSGISHIGTYR